jgi:hypothetical protein
MRFAAETAGPDDGFRLIDEFEIVFGSVSV